MMDNTNEMQIIFDSRPVNEGSKSNKNKDSFLASH